MKKLIWIVPAALFLLLLVAYFLLPAQPVIYKKVTLPVNQNAVVKLLTQQDKWQQWWPADDNEIVYDSLNFSFQQEMSKTAILRVPFKDTLLTAQLNTILYKVDLSGIIFQTSLPASSNPLQKISNYFRSQRIAGEAEEILRRLKAFAEKEENIYGFAVRQEKVKDSMLVAIRFQTTGYPETIRIYSAIAELRSYINAEGAKETGAPMLHTDPADNQQYRVMVAIPVNRVLNGNGPIEPKRMVLGNILVTEVKGGPHTVEKAMQVFQQYVIDHRRTSPAIPYQSLITDRLQQPDTTKWVTRLYYPVI